MRKFIGIKESFSIRKGNTINKFKKAIFMKLKVKVAEHTKHNLLTMIRLTQALILKFQLTLRKPTVKLPPIL